MNFVDKNKRIYVAGKNGMVGSAIWRILSTSGYRNLFGHSSRELDLRSQTDVRAKLTQINPDVVIIAAAKVGGILANRDFPYQFLMDNMQIQNNLISTSHELDINKVIFLGSSCIYPKFAEQPLIEDYLLTGSLESTNQWYAIAKISGLKACEALRIEYGRDYSSLMPTNLYGPNDNFDLTTSHVLPAMIRKFHEAKILNNIPVELWGTGSPLREFLHVDDLANAVIYALENELAENLYNVGSGYEITIKDLAVLIQNIVGHSGDIIFDSSKPDGTPRKVMDSNKMRSLGWKPKVDLENGIKVTYEWYLKNIESAKKVRITR